MSGKLVTKGQRRGESWSTTAAAGPKFTSDNISLTFVRVFLRFAEGFVFLVSYVIDGIFVVHACCFAEVH